MRRNLIATALLIMSSALLAQDMRIKVINQRGEPVAGAVVYVVTSLPADKQPTTAEPVIIDQINKEFVPHISAIAAGTAVKFPNRDNIRHHVYSFSPAKSFELPLYKDAPPAPVVFEKPGIVTLGCNIHDWMTSYIFVAPHRYFTVTGKDGSATMRDLPAQALEFEVWHPRQKEVATVTRQLVATGGMTLAFRIEEKTVLRPFRGQANSKNSY